MQLKEHVIYGGAAAGALSPFFGWDSLYFFAASVLIDADHYIDYLYFSRFRDWSPSKMFRFHGQMAAWRNRPHFCALEAFHTVEFMAAILLAGILLGSQPLVLVFSGLLFHLILDLVRLRRWGNIHLRALSFAEYAYRANKMRAAGVDPEAIFKEAYARISQPSRETGIPQTASS